MNNINKLISFFVLVLMMSVNVFAASDGYKCGMVQLPEDNDVFKCQLIHNGIAVNTVETKECNKNNGADFSELTSTNGFANGFATQQVLDQITNGKETNFKGFSKEAIDDINKASEVIKDTEKLQEDIKETAQEISFAGLDLKTQEEYVEEYNESMNDQEVKDVAEVNNSEDKENSSVDGFKETYEDPNPRESLEGIDIEKWIIRGLIAIIIGGSILYVRKKDGLGKKGKEQPEQDTKKLDKLKEEQEKRKKKDEELQKEIDEESKKEKEKQQQPTEEKTETKTEIDVDKPKADEEDEEEVDEPEMSPEANAKFEAYIDQIYDDSMKNYEAEEEQKAQT